MLIDGRATGAVRICLGPDWSPARIWVGLVSSMVAEHELSAWQQMGVAGVWVR